MKLGLGLIQTAFSANPAIDLDLVRTAENLGFHSAWVAEAYGCDAVSFAGWLAAHTERMQVGTAIMQMPARTPTAAAMAAIGLDALSGGRFILGLGPSGPQVVEGWHGVSYEKPLVRTREYVEIVRKVLARDEPVTYAGYHYNLPAEGPNVTGLGKPLRSVAHTNPEQPIFIASISPGGIRLTGEIADGVLLSFIDPADTAEIVDRHLAEGLAQPGARCKREDFTVSTFVSVVVHDDANAVMEAMRPSLARQLGGMGARSKNFYAEFARRMGYADEVEQIQSLYLAGDKDKAAAAVPLDLIDRTNLIGPAERIRERLGAWREAEARGSLDMMLITSPQREGLELLAEELL
ncbi:MAG: LLM class F420-dependent oxidoreductase [Halioglobus sp.]|nr:LLM class F420-dependent oxidoreductase [Halioglobus sp.]